MLETLSLLVLDNTGQVTYRVIFLTAPPPLKITSFSQYYLKYYVFRKTGPTLKSRKCRTGP